MAANCFDVYSSYIKRMELGNNDFRWQDWQENDDFEWQGYDEADEADERSEQVDAIEKILNDTFSFAHDIINDLSSYDELKRKHAADKIIELERKFLELATALDDLFDNEQDEMQVSFTDMMVKHCLVGIMRKVSDGRFVRITPRILDKCYNDLNVDVGIMKRKVTTSCADLNPMYLEMFFSNSYHNSYYKIKKDILDRLYECDLFGFVVAKVENIETPQAKTIENLFDQNDKIREVAQEEVRRWMEKCAEIGSNMDQLCFGSKFYSNVFYDINEMDSIVSRSKNVESILSFIDFSEEWIIEAGKNTSYEMIYNNEKLRTFLNNYIKIKRQIFERLKGDR